MTMRHTGCGGEIVEDATRALYRDETGEHPGLFCQACGQEAGGDGDISIPGYDDEDEFQRSLGKHRPAFEFITGTAGTGKTFLARSIADEHYGAELCATTGIAAVNLGAGVTTLNSKLGYFDTASLRDSWTTGNLTRRLGRLIDRDVSRLIVDEVSMMDVEQLIILCAALDELKEAHVHMGLTLVGDFCQLPPIKATFAFETEVWPRFRENMTILKDIRRQTDLEFIGALQAVRRGDRLKAVEYFGDKLERVTDPDYPGPTILAKNLEVERFNLLRHAKLPTTERYRWTSSRWGTARSEWKLIPDVLDLKEGALVMVLANQPEYELTERGGQKIVGYTYVNGDLGYLQGDYSGNGSFADVKLNRDGRVVNVSKVTRENLIPLDPERRRALEEEDAEAFRVGNMEHTSRIRGDRRDFEATGGVTYMPLRLAYATTVHKSQGLTLDDVQVSIVDHFWENPGMVYVALSRSRTAGGLRVVGSRELFMKRIRVDPRVKEWV
jgi:ATP-dependent DNA helicase PIF1